MITWKDFEKVEIRVGTIIDIADSPKAKKPAYRLRIDFGEFGVKKSSAQITGLYSKEELLDKQVVAVTNFPPRQVADFMSEVLVLGVVLEGGSVVLLEPERKVPDGCRIA